jgi:ABC-type sugar transport system substrate-binding protein
MGAHLAALMAGAVTCAYLAHYHPDSTRPFCAEADKAFQEAAEAYIAVVLALLVPTGTDDQQK